jgi:hypothetical protein
MRVVFSFLAALIGLAIGAMAFLVVFVAPAFIWGDGIMLAWGWIAPIFGLGVGWGIAKLIAEAAFFSLTAAASLRARRALAVILVLCLWMALVTWLGLQLATRLHLPLPW